jgi:hypothetical protein
MLGSGYIEFQRLVPVPTLFSKMESLALSKVCFSVVVFGDRADSGKMQTETLNVFR